MHQINKEIFNNNKIQITKILNIQVGLKEKLNIHYPLDNYIQDKQELLNNNNWLLFLLQKWY